MSLHNCSVFKNSCIKTPINPANRLPNPVYDRRAIKSATLSSDLQKPKLNNMMSGGSGDSEENEKNSNVKDCDGFMSFIDFYESIPEYNEINHLSAKEFYSHLDTLRRKQQELRTFCFSTTNYLRKPSNNNRFEDPAENEKYTKNCNNISLVEDKMKFRELNSKTPPVRFSDKDSFFDDDSLVVNLKKNNFLSTKSKMRKGSAKSGGSTSLRSSGTPLPNFSDDELPPAPPPAVATQQQPATILKSGLRSKSVSPCRYLSPAATVTIPKPFKMTQREEEERMLDDLIASSKCFSPNESPKKEKNTQFKANPVPLTSRIPLYKHIVAEQEHKNELAKLNSSIELQSQMKPFSFDEKKPTKSNRCLIRSNSTPNLSTPLIKPCKLKSFRAKPCPKNLFSNYFYQKLWEDDYFRCLNRKIRAEELLKVSSLPPSMAKRENKTQKKSRDCFRSESSFSGNSSKKSKRKKRHKKRNSSGDMNGSGKKTTTNYSQQNNEFITTSTEPFQFETEKRYQKRISKPPPSSTATTGSISNDSMTNASSAAMHLYPASRPNLAATLRAQWSRKKIHSDREEEMVPPLRTKLKRVDWGVRKSSAWKSIYFDGTNDDDISMRLATRRAEQRLRQEQHSINMELMRQRVRAAPLLLEGPTHWGPRVGKMSHDCGREAQEKMLRKLKKPRPTSSTTYNRQNASKLSNYSDGKVSYESSVKKDQHHHHLHFCDEDEIRKELLDDLESYDDAVLL